MSDEANDEESILGLLSLRISTVIGEQRERIDDWCEEHDYPVDRYIACSDPFKLLDMVNKGDTVVMTSYQCIRRNPEEFLTFARHCNERGVHLIMIDEQMTVPGHSADIGAVVEEALENFG